jgi:SAM-dependent methyltransferase
VTVIGNINEALDVWAEDIDLPPLAEGDTLCLLNAGGYGASMASAHCLRTELTEHLLTHAEVATPETARGRCAANRDAWDRLYASTPALVWGPTPVPFLPDVVAKLRTELPNAAVALDAGTGEGRNLPVLLASGFEVHAVDASRSALAKIPAPLRSHVAVREASLDATGYADGAFDLVLAIDVFETLPALPLALRELARILKPGGFLVCNIPGMDDGVAGIEMQELGGNEFLYRDTYYYRFIESAEAAALLTGAGLAIKTVCRCEWTEEPHPGFRPEGHRHVSQVFVAQRPLPPA